MMRDLRESIYRTGVWLILIWAAVGLSGCGREEAAGDGKDGYADSYVYVSRFYSLDEGINGIVVCDGSIYYSTSEERFYRWNPDDGSEPEQLMIPQFDENAYRWVLQPDRQGGFYVIYSGAEKTYLTRYDAEGGELLREDITELIEGYAVEDTAVDAQGHLFVRGGWEVFMFDTDGTHHMTVTAAEPEMINRLAGNEKGEVYCNTLQLGSSQPIEAIRSISYENGLSAETCDNYRGGNGFAAYGESGFLSALEGHLYLYDRETESQEVLLEWMNCGIETNQVQQFGALEDGRIVALLQETSGEGGELAILTKTERSQAPQREVITVGVFTASQNLRQTAARFNRQNEQYRVEVKEYYDAILDAASGDEGREEARRRLHLDMISDNCPDILNLEYDDLETYIRKGILEDLTPYLAGSESLDILPAVWEAYSFDGKLVSLPNRIQIRTIVGRTSETGERTSWTMEEMLDFIDSYEGKTVLAVNQQKMLEYLLMLNLARFVNWEEYSCNFVSEDFYRLLEYSSRFSKYSDNVYASVLNVKNRKAILYEVLLNQAEDVMLLKQLLNDEELTFVGFPTEDGSSGNVLEAVEGSYSIFAKSDHKAGAWSFLELLLTYCNTSPISISTRSSGFPVDRGTCERYFEAAMEEPYLTNDADTEERRISFSLIEGNMRIYYYVPLPEEVEPIRELIDFARTDKNSGEQVLSIICEEAEAYFNGVKSAEETAEVIQSKVSLYLKERS